ncbi:hypothetical protein B0H63DRAFT_490537 [Podospora didyma]|uniref:F-box domain-containing protein n=1 Tax=Podospora didyma TaxID=330526 RepID=A0AAE0JYW1_9PEZI|nr:hypothetical protein B0H63DRAFT_490537 [Podospora didyma]
MSRSSCLHDHVSAILTILVFVVSLTTLSYMYPRTGQQWNDDGHSIGTTTTPPSPPRRYWHRRNQSCPRPQKTSGEPGAQAASGALGQLGLLPPELLFAIFDFLSLLDSTCLGLASKYLYLIHRRLHGTVPLSTRLPAPNSFEWAWQFSSLSHLGGSFACPKCDINRCELYRHIQSWMGDGLQYCSVRRKFGSVAPRDTTSYCHRANPAHPSCCGRHRDRLLPPPKVKD